MNEGSSFLWSCGGRCWGKFGGVAVKFTVILEWCEEDQDWLSGYLAKIFWVSLAFADV